VAGRFGCHDLLRAYAAELASTTLSTQERDLARRRVLDHYVHTARAATARLYPARGLVPLPRAVEGVTPEEFTGPEAYEAALAWFEVEHRVLRNVIEQAAARQQDAHCWTLAWYWAPILKRRGRLHEALATQETAVLAAGRLSDQSALAHVHYELGYVMGRLGDYSSADERMRESLALFADLGDRACVAQVRQGLAKMYELQGRFDEALDHAVEALRLRRSLDDPAAVAYSENAVGWMLAHLGQPDAALWYCRRALEMHTESGSRTGVADTIDSIAYAYSQLGDYAQAVEYYERALTAYRRLGDVHSEANSRLQLGDIQFASGQENAARLSWEQSLALFNQVPGADTSEATARLRRTAGPGSRPARLESRNNHAGSSAVKLRTPVSDVTREKRC
jgi:tetratricopeptide (TPR) repeat protein